jgi:signal transduction histidine kinase
MVDYRRRAPSLAVSGAGLVLALVAVGHHSREIAALGELSGPLSALLLDGIPAVGVIYAGFWLARSDFTTGQQWRVCGWSLAGGVLFSTVLGLSMLVRSLEGRIIPEPIFPLLLAADVGAIAGFIAGYYNGQARGDAVRAQQASDALGFVNSVLRHDLRNDLNVVQGHADLLAAELGDDASETVKQYAATIRQKAEEALERIEDTGTIAATVTGTAAFEAVDIVPIVRATAERIEGSYPVSVTTELPATARVTANDGLRSVVDNLLENAAEHNDADEPELAVTVAERGDSVRLTVSDNGPGIPDEKKTAVVEDLTHGTERGGLDLAATLVDSYGGTMSITDNQPHGTTITVELDRG